MSVLAHEGTYPILYGTYAVPVGSGHRNGYLARPDRAGRFPTVLVLPESGITSHHKDLSRRLARQGLATVAIDLPNALDEAIGTVDEAHEFVMVSEWAVESHLGVLGFGSGGLPAVAFAADQPVVRAVAVVSTPIDETGPLGPILSRLSVPLLGLYGSEEPIGSEIDGQPAPDATFVRFQGVASGFMDDGSVGFDTAASLDAQRRLFEFFRVNLPAPKLERIG